VTSLRFRLFTILVAATGLIWLFAVAWIYLGTRNELEHVLDTRLQEAARMVGSLVTNGEIATDISRGQSGIPRPEPASYERQLSCQIWSLDGHLIARSSGAPGDKLSDGPAGFSERTVDGELWRVFAVEDLAKGVRVLVGDRLGLRDRLVRDLVEGLLVPAVTIVPLLALLIWMSLGRGLQPLRSMALELQARDADDMAPVDARHAPHEVRPLAEALNALFGKVEAARRHEREMTAFAAHELRTPLAGLKLQAQVALAASEPDTRDRALRQIMAAVDRTTRLIRQLLAISALDAEEAGHTVTTPTAVGQLLRTIVEADRSFAAQIVIDPALERLALRVDHDLLTLALRNLHENAVVHMPDGGQVRWGVNDRDDGGATVFVEDEGPGIPENELSTLGRRFFRGQNKSASGSGLGLAIVTLASRRIGAVFTLRNRRDRVGARAEVAFPPSVRGSGGQIAAS